MRGLFAAFPTQRRICAELDGEIVGLTGVAEPGTCQPTTTQRVRLLPAVAGFGPRTAARVLAWTSAWARLDPAEPHVHLGPLAVDVTLQGRGIGSRIMAEHCRRLDVAHAVGYLETDKAENVAFYRKFGYEVIAEQPVLDVPNWFMRRSALQRGRSQ